VNAIVLTAPLVMTACTATVGVGVSAPVYGGWVRGTAAPTAASALASASRSG